MSWFDDTISKPLDVAKIVEALKANDVAGATAIMAEYTGDDLTDVASRALSAGADPVMIDEILKLLGSGETVNVTAKYKPPVIVGFRWSWVAAGLGGFAFGMFLRARLR